jgi:hypothetical protein
MGDLIEEERRILAEEEYLPPTRNGQSRVNSTELKISQLPIEDERVRYRALEIFHEIQLKHKRTFKQRTQNEVIFICVWQAYTDLDMPVDPRFVINFLSQVLAKEGKKFRLSVDNAFQYYTPKIPAPEKFVPFYLYQYFSILDAKRSSNKGKSGENISPGRIKLIERAVEFIRLSMKKCEENKAMNDWMESCTLTNIIIGGLVYFLQRSKDEIFSMPAFEQAVYLTSVCINKYHLLFEKHYNT